MILHYTLPLRRILRYLTRYIHGDTEIVLNGIKTSIKTNLQMQLYIKDNSIIQLIIING